MKKYLTHIIWVVIAIAAFIGGMYYGKATASPSLARGQFGNFAGATRTGGTFVASRNGSTSGIVAGQVTAKDAQSITVALPNGNSQIVFYSSSTTFEQPSPATIGDISTGTDIMVSGTANSDGSFTAQSIQVRPRAAAPGGSFGQ